MPAADAVRPAPDPSHGRTLALLPIGIGNVLMATPALRALSAGIGVDRLDVLALKPGTAEMARASGLVTTAHVWDPDTEGLGRGISCLRDLRAEGYAHSLALFPSASWKSSAYQWAIGAADRFGFDYPTQRMPRMVQHRSLPLKDTHDVYQNLRLAEAFLTGFVATTVPGKDGASAGLPAEPFFPMPLAFPADLPAEPFFACHPGSSMERGMGAKRLPAAEFATLISAVSAETGARCVLVGGPEEAALREEVAAGCREALLPVTTRSLAETAGVLERAWFFLGNDSGLMHVAASVGTRCAAYFGPTDERRTGPFGYWERVGDAPRHLILRRPGSVPVWTLKTIGSNPPLAEGAASAWALDPAWAKSELAAWVATLGAPADA
jgi:ADP-heptose:LPS heptosyltransferase